MSIYLNIPEYYVYVILAVGWLCGIISVYIGRLVKAKYGKSPE
jgi:hypothetical protein